MSQFISWESYKSAREHQKQAEAGHDIGDGTEQEHLGKHKRRKTKNQKFDDCVANLSPTRVQQIKEGKKIMYFYFFNLCIINLSVCTGCEPR